VVTRIHVVLGEPYGAKESAQEALSIYTALGDPQGQGTMLLTLAEMERSLGNKGEATKLAEQALKFFRQSGSKLDQEKALQTLSGIFVERGHPEKAPQRAEALKALNSFAKAVELRKGDEVKAIEGQLNRFGNVLQNDDISNVLQPLYAKDAEAQKYIEETLDWESEEKVGATSEGTVLIKGYPHKAFYLQTVFGGMGFGPQFRSVHPYKKFENKSLAVSSHSVCQLPETEAWQMELGWRPGYLDAPIQNLATVGYP